MNELAMQRVHGPVPRQPPPRAGREGSGRVDLPSPSPEFCTIYATSQCTRGQRSGAWAYVALIGDTVQEESGEDIVTTPRRLEIIAVIKGLTASPSESTVRVITNARIVQQRMTAWQQGAPARRGQSSEDHDLWGQLEELVAERRVTWTWLQAYVAQGTRDHYHIRAQQLAHATERRAARHGSRATDAREPMGRAPTHGVSPAPRDDTVRPPSILQQEWRERAEQGRQSVEVNQPKQRPALNGEPPFAVNGAGRIPMSVQETMVDTGPMNRTGSHDKGSVAPANDMAATRTVSPEYVDQDEKRRVLIAECWTLAQRWADLRVRIVDLDSEWQHLLEPLRNAMDMTTPGHQLDWADGALVFHDLGEHAAHLSSLTTEALRTCQQYAIALRSATEGLESAETHG